MPHIKVRLPTYVNGIIIPSHILTNPRLTLNKDEAWHDQGMPLVYHTYRQGKKLVHVFLKK